MKNLKIVAFILLAVLTVWPLLAADEPVTSTGERVPLVLDDEAGLATAATEPPESRVAVEENLRIAAELEASVFAAGGSCGWTTTCGRPYNPTWNAYCNNFCINAGHAAGFCGRNGGSACCICATDQPH